MSVESQDYKFEILEYAVNQSIDRLLPSSSKDALSVILYQSNEIVWKVATEIYTKSGHHIDFVFIRDVLNLRVEPLRRKIAEEKIIRKEREIEEARIKAESEAQRLAKIVEEERLKKERETELERIRAEKERIRKEKKAEEAKIKKQREKAKQEKLQQIIEVYPNIDIDIFLRIERLIIKALIVEEEQITLDSILCRDLGADTLDTVELIMAIEEEFDIKIPDDFTETHWIYSICGDYSRLESITVKEIVDIVLEKIQHKY